MVVVDTKSIAQNNGVALMGDVSARVVDLINIVCNRNTIPGDRDATRPSALRLGTAWVTQRGLKEADMGEIASAIASVLKTARPFTLTTAKGALQFRAKVDFDALINSAERVSQLCAKAGVDGVAPQVEYPHVWEQVSPVNGNKLGALEVSGENARPFMQYVFSSDVAALQAEETQPSWLLERSGVPMSPTIISNLGATYRLAVPSDKLTRVARWLRAISDGYVLTDDHDLQAKIPGPVMVKQVGAEGFDSAQLPTALDAASVAGNKPYYIGKPA